MPGAKSRRRDHKIRAPSAAATTPPAFQQRERLARRRLHLLRGVGVVIEYELPGFDSVLVGFARRHVGTRPLGGILLAATLYRACGRFGCSAIRGLTIGHCPSSCCPAVSRCLRHRGLPRLSRDTPPPKRSPGRNPAWRRCHPLRQSSEHRWEPARGPICSISPSTVHEAPVTEGAAGDARTAMTSATSRARPGRRAGCRGGWSRPDRCPPGRGALQKSGRLDQTFPLGRAAVFRACQ